MLDHVVFGRVEYLLSAAGTSQPATEDPAAASRRTRAQITAATEARRAAPKAA